jgi:hypothetical protein
MQPAIFPALGWAPLMPPSPEVRKVLLTGFGLFYETHLYCDGRAMYNSWSYVHIEPAVICPYCDTPKVHFFSQSSGLE